MMKIIFRVGKEKLWLWTSRYRILNSEFKKHFLHKRINSNFTQSWIYISHNLFGVIFTKHKICCESSSFFFDRLRKRSWFSLHINVSLNSSFIKKLSNKTKSSFNNSLETRKNFTILIWKCSIKMFYFSFE